MAAKLIISASNHRRIREARSWLEAREPTEEVLIVGATLDAANELARTVARERGAVLGWHRLSLPQLAAAVARPTLASRGLVPISRIGTHAIAARLVHKLKQGDGLGRYDTVAGTPGFPRAVAAVIMELRLANLSHEHVRPVAPDLVPLVSSYERELSEVGLIDWAGVLELAAAAASGDKSHQMIGLRTLLLDVPVNSESELRFVQAIATRAPELLVTACTADQPTLTRNPALGGERTTRTGHREKENHVAAARVHRLPLVLPAEQARGSHEGRTDTDSARNPEARSANSFAR